MRLFVWPLIAVGAALLAFARVEAHLSFQTLSLAQLFGGQVIRAPASDRLFSLAANLTDTTFFRVCSRNTLTNRGPRVYIH